MKEVGKHTWEVRGRLSLALYVWQHDSSSSGGSYRETV
jgi:hypothetical protein